MFSSFSLTQNTPLPYSGSMQPKIPLRITRPHVWSHNTSYVGASGKHSENSSGARARNTIIDNRLIKVVSVLKEMERKEFQQIEKSKREIQNSMLALTERVKQINASRLCYSSAEGSETNSRYSTSTVDSNGQRNYLSPSDRSSQTSLDSERTSLRRRKLSPVKSRRVSLPKVKVPSEKTTDRQRRHSSVSNIMMPIKSNSPSVSRLLRDNNSRSPTLSSSDGDDFPNSTSNNKVKQEETNNCHVTISPFPYDSYDTKDSRVHHESNSPRKTFSVNQHKKRVNYKQYKEEKDIERERVLIRKKVMSDTDSLDHKKEIMHEKAQHRRAAILLEKARQDALKNKKDICNTFCYSFAMEELMKKSDPLAFVASEKDFVSKVEVDKDGTIKQTLGPAVLTIIGVDELNNYQGMRIKWSAKYRPQNYEENEQIEEGSFLPPITVGGHKHSFSRQVTREQEQLELDKICTDAQSTVSAVSVDV